MIAAPWYLLSFGILVLVIGLIGASLKGASQSGQPMIDPNMDDDQILQNLEGQGGVAWPNLLVFAGLVLVAISIVWRLARMLF